MWKENYEYDDRENITYYTNSYYEEWYKYDKNNNKIYEKRISVYESYEMWYKYDKYNRDVYFKANDGREEWFKYNKNGERIDITEERLRQRMYLTNKKINRFEIMDI